MSSNTPKSIFSRIDGITLLLYFILVMIGIIAIFTVEYRSTDIGFFIAGKNYMKQLLWLAISLFAGLLILFTDSKFFSSVAYLLYTIGLFLLIITIFISTDIKGSHSWIKLGSASFQPGEACKIFTALALAKFLSSPDTNFSSLKDQLIGIAIAMVPAVIIILQNETGLALVYFAFFLAMYREGLPNAVLIIGFSLVILTISTLLVDGKVLFVIITLLAILFGVLIRRTLRRDNIARLLLVGVWLACVLFSQVMVPLAFKKVLQGYQVERIYSMLGQDVPDNFKRSGPDAEPVTAQKKSSTTDYNVNQSKIAIGSGGFWGKGILNGTSTKNQFVPEQHTDFIFCSIGEQFGFVGCFVLIAIYITLMMRIIFLAERQRSAFSRVYAYCVASILFFHFAINISMTIGLAPVIGITLPFLSYGGTSLLAFSVLIFILIRLDADRQVMIR